MHEMSTKDWVKAGTMLIAIFAGMFLYWMVFGY